MDERCTLLVGDCRALLSRLPTGCIDCVVTSPPYFGLRSYNTNPQCWGGEAGCVHEWVTDCYYREGGNSVRSKDAFHAAGPENAKRLKETRWRETTGCSKCGAWRGELGGEPTPDLFITHLVDVCRQLWRVLRDDGTLWLNLGDSYARPAGKGQHKPGDSGKQAAVIERGGGRASTEFDLAASNLKAKDLIGIPWRAALALQSARWFLRSDIVWEKPNAMPESVTDRPTRSHEYLFLLTKSSRYFYDAAAIREPTVSKHASGNGFARPEQISRGGRGNKQPWEPTEFRNRRSVWTINTGGYKGAHFATFPPALVEPCVLAGCPEGGYVLDPFAGSGTVGEVALKHGRRCILMELNPEYGGLIADRLAHGPVGTVVAE